MGDERGLSYRRQANGKNHQAAFESHLARAGRDGARFKPFVYKVWPEDQQHQHRLGAG